MKNLPVSAQRRAAKSQAQSDAALAAALERARHAGIAYARTTDASPAGADIIMAGLDSQAMRDAFWRAYRQESARGAGRAVTDGNW